MNSPDNDGQFVDELLAQAQVTLGDPRVQFIHVRHAGPAPADIEHAEPRSDTNASSVAQRAAWAQTSELAATLRELWEHAWLPDSPTEMGVRYLGGPGNLRVEVTAHSKSTGPAAADTAADRLLVRGFLPDDDASSPTTTRVRREDHDIVVDSTGPGVSMTLSAALEVAENTTLDALAGLPTHVSPTSEGR